MKIGQTLYLDYQASTPLDPRVLEVMSPYLVENFANPHSTDHAPGWRATEAVETAAAQVGKLIGSDADEIIFTSGATESNNLALIGLARRAANSKRKRILVSAIEHKCILAVGRVLQEQLGFKVEYLPVDSEGRLIFSALEQSINEDVLAVSVMAVNNEIGTIQDVERVSEITSMYDVIFHCDAAQAPCAVDLKYIVQYVHLLSLSGHKMYGPKGIGALFIRHDLQRHIEPLIYGGDQQHGLRPGTVPVALCVGMGAAAQLLTVKEAKQERELIRGHRDRFVRDLRSLEWPVELNGPEGAERHSGNANLRFMGFLAHDILGALQPYLAASTGSACTSGIPGPSHVLRAIGLCERDAEASIRFSLGRATTDADVLEAVGLINETLARLTRSGLWRSPCRCSSVAG